MVGWSGTRRPSKEDMVGPRRFTWSTKSEDLAQERSSFTSARSKDQNIVLRYKHAVDMVALNRLRRRIKDINYQSPTQPHCHSNLNDWKAALIYVDKHLGFESWQEDFDWVFRILSTGCKLSTWQEAMSYACKELEFDTTEWRCAWVFRLVAVGSDAQAWKEALTFALKNLHFDTPTARHECVFRFLESGQTLDAWRKALTFASKYVQVHTITERHDWVFRFLATNRRVDEWRDAESYMEEIGWNLDVLERREWIFRFLETKCGLEAWREAVEFAMESLTCMVHKDMREWVFQLLASGWSLDAYKEAWALCKDSLGLMEDPTWVFKFLSTDCCVESWAVAKAYADNNLVFDNEEEYWEWVFRFLATGGDVKAYTQALSFADKSLGYKTNEEDSEWVFRFLASGGNLEVWAAAMEYATLNLDLEREACCEWVFRFVATGRSLESWRTALRFAVVNLNFDTTTERREWVFRFLNSGRQLRGPGSYSESWFRALKHFADHRKQLGLKKRAKGHAWVYKVLAMEACADVRKEASRLAMTHAGLRNAEDVCEFVLRFVSSGTYTEAWKEALHFASSRLQLTTQDTSTWVHTVLSTVIMSQKRSLVNDSECVICLEPLNSRATQRLPCSHLFHCVCFARWSTARPDDLHCPSCRAPVSI